MASEFNSLFAIEYSFNKLLASYILFSNLDKFSSQITIGNGRKFKFSIKCDNISREKKLTLGKNEVSISFDLIFIVEKENLTFIKFYYKLSDIYKQNLNFNPNYLIENIIPEILLKIKASKSLKASSKNLLEYDEKNKGVFKKFENIILQDIKRHQGIYFRFKEEIHDKFFDISPENYEIIEFLIEEFKKQNHAHIDISELYNDKEQYLFELYYKQVICDDISYQLQQPKNYHLLSLKDPNLEEHGAKEGLLATENTIFLGRIFQEVIKGELKDPEDIENYNKISKVFDNYLTDHTNTPYSILFAENFNHKTFTAREILYLYKNPIGKGKSRGVFPYNRFKENYLKGTLTKDQKDFIERIKNTLGFSRTVFGKESDDYPTKTFPRLFFNGDTFGIISLENLTNTTSSINLRVIVFNTSSKAEIDCLYHFKNSWNFSKSSLILKRVREQKYLIEKLFDFYPYHPFFFNRKNYYARFYTAFALGESPSSKSLDEKLDNLYLTSQELDILWKINSLEGINLKATGDAIKIILIEQVLDAYNKNLFLWMMIYLEKYQHFLGMVENNKPFASRNKWTPQTKFGDFIEDVEKYLNENFQDDRSFKIVVNSIAKSSKKYSVVGVSAGLYILLIYYKKSSIMHIIKLNCSSFSSEEVEFFSKVLEFSESGLKIEEFQVPSNFMRGLRVSGMDFDTFKDLTKKPYNWIQPHTNRSVYDFLLKAHKLSEMNVFKKNWSSYLSIIKRGY
ncbi:MAG: hypothetical protein ACFFDB_00320 [Promethearchaeota archaeon]